MQSTAMRKTYLKKLCLFKLISVNIVFVTKLVIHTFLFQILCTVKTQNFLSFHTRSLLFVTLSDDGSGCIECVGTTETVAAINMITNVSIYLPVIYYLFPNVQHLTVNSLPPNEVNTARSLLPLFTRHSSLTIKGV